jgi:BirA family transcriptional regulator, biotin operon repressor / biotin---[acetyl-CoA-carboxylase] ligase
LFDLSDEGKVLDFFEELSNNRILFLRSDAVKEIFTSGQNYFTATRHIMSLLKLLNTTTYISGQKIAKSLDISRAAVHKRIQALRDKGYKISGGSNHGYILVSKPDLMIPEEVRSHFTSPNSLAKNIIYNHSLASTQTLAKEIAANGGGHGTLVIAEKQSAGYGRVRRRWASPKGGMWFSLLLRPVINPEKVPVLALVVSLSLAQTLEKALGLAPKIKWPNDIMLDGKKTVGILIEMSAEIGRVNWVVAGIGINANNKISGVLSGKAASISAKTGGKIDRPALVAKILDDLEKHYEEFLTKDFCFFKRAYNERSFLNGRKVLVREGDSDFEGKVESVDDVGRLELRLNNGTTRKIVSGELKSW